MALVFLVTNTSAVVPHFRCRPTSGALFSFPVVKPTLAEPSCWAACHCSTAALLQCLQRRCSCTPLSESWAKGLKASLNICTFLHIFLLGLTCLGVRGLEPRTLGLKSDAIVPKLKLLSPECRQKRFDRDNQRQGRNISVTSSARWLFAISTPSTSLTLNALNRLETQNARLFF